MKDFRYFAEQVSHHPPISAVSIEGQGFKSFSNTKVRQTFQFGGGKGALKFEQMSCADLCFTDNDERVVVTQPTVYANNLILGQIWCDLGGSIIA